MNNIEDNSTHNLKKRVIMTCSVQGGEGKTSFLVTLGLYILIKQLAPIGIDTDPSGHLLRWMNQHSSFDMEEVVRAVQLKDKDRLDSMLTGKIGDFRLLGTKSPGNNRALEKEWTNICNAYMELYSPILIDTEPAYRPIIRELGQNCATDIFMLHRIDDYRNHRLLEMYERIKQECPAAAIHIVFNKFEDRHKVHPFIDEIRVKGLTPYFLPISALMINSDTVFNHNRQSLQETDKDYLEAFEELVEKTLEI